jgi:receptor protein-tyrosine kinase
MPDEPDLRRYLKVVRRQLVLVASMAVICAVAALAVSLAQSKTYKANATLLYTPNQLPGTSQEDPARALATRVSLATTQRVLTAAAPAAGTSAQKLRNEISASADPAADLVQITASAGSPAAAARYANAVATTFVALRDREQRQTVNAELRSVKGQLSRLPKNNSATTQATSAALTQQLATLQGEAATTHGDLQLAEPATPPTSAASPKPLRNAGIGLIVGLLLGITAALIRDRLDRRLRTVSDIEEAYALPTLGTVPRVAAAVRGDRHAGLGDYAGSSHLVEAYRNIRTNLSLFRLRGDEMRVIVISSAVAGEGKSAATANLAAALATSGRRVLAMSVDIRSPTLHQYFGRHGDAGVIDVLSEEATLSDAARYAPLNGRAGTHAGEVALLSNDRHFSDPAVLYQSGAMKRLLEDARSRYDVVLLDAPPLLYAGEASVLAQQADAVILVSRVDQVTRDEARRAMALLRAAGVDPLGIIVTNVSADEDVYSGYGYGYGARAEA